MTGYIIQANGGPPLGAAFPARYDDPRIDAGTLLLLDPAHSQTIADGMPKATAPANNQRWPNLAWKPAARLTGKTKDDRALLDPVLSLSGFAPDELKIERTPAGALHGITSPTLLDNGDAAFFDIPTAIEKYFFDFGGDYPVSDHQFYISLWIYITRPASTVTNPTQPYFYISTATGNPIEAAMYPTQLVPRAGQTIAGIGDVGNANVNTAGAQRLVVTPNQWANDKPANAAAVEARLGWGAFGGFGPYGVGGKTPSFIFESLLIKDLTVTGKTFAQANAEDLAEWTAAHAVGGRYYDHTVTTDPATFA
ncbi:hypothetical protein [Sphingomonas hylomeconis]|uniref:Major tail protein n=1 Tax=Sphingomonas hylomeconis TaxID=1395958 RepID=A0ABV7SXS6_9SPHN|nr:hypothetical protein [Sphingomonas hylomeconis]